MQKILFPSLTILFNNSKIILIFLWTNNKILYKMKIMMMMLLPIIKRELRVAIKMNKIRDKISNCHNKLNLIKKSNMKFLLILSQKHSRMNYLKIYNLSLIKIIKTEAILSYLLRSRLNYFINTKNNISNNNNFLQRWIKVISSLKNNHSWHKILQKVQIQQEI